MKKILVICHIDKNKFDGQQSKTNDVISSFEKRGYEIEILNYGHKNILSLFFVSLKQIKKHNNVLLLPGGRKALFFYTFLSRIFKNKNFYYLAVGGWVVDLIQNKKYERKLSPLKRFRCVVLQNKHAIDVFNSYGFENLLYIPTFSSKEQITPKEFEESLAAFDKSKQYRFCFFARVEESKGVFEACNVIKRLARDNYDVKLDIYGQIQKKDMDSKLSGYLDENIKYLGVIHENVIGVLSSYYCMLFPTYYKGEGMAHSIIESFMAGLPVITTDWKYNSELVKENETGFLVNLDQLEDNLYNKTLFAIKNKKLIRSLRTNCFSFSRKFNSDEVLKPFIDLVDRFKI